MTIISPTPPAVRKQISEIEFCGWVGQAAPGDVFEYHRGFLALDTFPHDSRLPERDRAELASLARRAWWAAERGLIHLVQRRHKSSDYSYFAIARPKPKQAPASISSLLPAEDLVLLEGMRRRGRPPHGAHRQADLRPTIEPRELR